jgi:hypothetical protein
MSTGSPPRSAYDFANAKRGSGNADSTHVLGGDFFTDTLPEADAYVLMEVIHDWDDDHAEKILRAVRNAAPIGSKVLLVEAMMPDDQCPAGLQPWMSSCSICSVDDSVVYRNIQACSISAVLTRFRKFPLEQATLLFMPHSPRGGPNYIATACRYPCNVGS